MKAINTLRRFAFGAMTALALLAGSAVKAEPTMQVYMPYSGQTVSMSASDHARQYSQAKTTLTDGGLVGVCLSDKGYNTDKCYRKMTDFELIVYLDNTAGSAGRNAGANGTQ